MLNPNGVEPIAGEPGFMAARYPMHTPWAAWSARNAFGACTTPTHCVSDPVPEQLHRKGLGVGVANGPTTLGAGAKAGSALAGVGIASGCSCTGAGGVTFGGGTGARGGVGGPGGPPICANARLA